MTACQPGPADPAIIIFGAAVLPDGQPSPTLRRRTEAAAQFGLTLHRPLYLPTGGVGRHGPAEAAVMAAVLRGHGIGDASILPETTGTDTLSSVRACAALLRARQHRGTVWVCSSAYHLPRCVALVRLAGLPARAAPPPPGPAASRLPDRWYWRLRETAAIPVDVALILSLRLRGAL